MSCLVCGGLGVLTLPVGPGEWAQDFWCDCTGEHDPRRWWHPTRTDFASYRAAFPDWRERLSRWRARLAAQAVTGNGRESGHG